MSHPRHPFLRHIPIRLAAGAYILNSGLNKRHLPVEAAAALQHEAAGAIPVAGSLQPATFGKALSRTEMTVGALLLAPFVPPAAAGAALAAFSGGLLTMYLRTPGLHLPGSPRPTPKGIPLAKDAWLMGIALTLIFDAALTARHRTGRAR